MNGKDLPTRAKEHTTSLVCTPLILTFMRVQRQKGSNDSDVFALVTFATNLLHMLGEWVFI